MGFDETVTRRLSKAECCKGYLIATQLAKMPSRTRAWLRNKIRRYYRGGFVRPPVAWVRVGGVLNFNCKPGIEED